MEASEERSMATPGPRQTRVTRPRPSPPTLEAKLGEALRSAPDWAGLERAFLAAAAAIAEGTISVQAARRLRVIGKAERLRRERWNDPTNVQR